MCSVVSEIAIGVHWSLNGEDDVLFQSHDTLLRLALFGLLQGLLEIKDTHCHRILR